MVYLKKISICGMFFVKGDISKFICFHLVLRSIVNIIVTKLIRTNCLKNILSRRFGRFLCIFLTVNEVPTNHVTIGKYIKYLCNAFIFYEIKRYDIRGKKYLENADKFYMD